MQARHMMFLGLAVLAFLYARMQKRLLRPQSGGRQLQGWHKIFGVVAVLLVMLILLNPELFALGLLGDTAFFDVLALALSTQMQTFVGHAWARLGRVLAVDIWRVWIPSPGLGYLLGLASIGSWYFLFSVQKAGHRLFIWART